MTESAHGNWGRWGADDERGALNLVTPTKTVEACRLARDGRVFTLGRQIRYGMLMSTDRPAPTYVLTVDGGDYAAGARSFGRAKLSDDFLSFSPGSVPTWTASRMPGRAISCITATMRD